MKAFKVFGILVSALFLWQCGSQNEIATNYYADGIYYDPSYGELLVDAEEQTETPANDDYFNPNYQSSQEEYQYSNTSNYNSGWSGGMSMGYSSMYSPYGMGSMMSIGYNNPYSMGMNDFGYGYNPYGMYNPYCGGYGMGGGFGMGGYYPYNPYYGGGYYGNPYNPYYGYPGTGGGAYEPTNVYGNNIKNPDVVIQGGSTPRSNRNSAGTVSSSGTQRTKSGKQAGEPILRQSQVNNATENKEAKNQSRMRQASESRNAVYERKNTSNQSVTNRTVTPVNRQSEDLLYRKASRNASPARTSGNTRTTNGGNVNTTRTISTPSTLERQTENVIRRTSGNANNRSESAPTRSYSPANTGNTRSYSPSGNSGGVRSSAPATRSSGGGGGGGGQVRTSTGTRR